MASTLVIDNNSAPGAASQLQPRAGSAPADDDAKNARLEELAESNPPAANLAWALITAGHSIPAAIWMVTAAVAHFGSWKISSMNSCSASA
ncbi:unnamed protein product [Tilletia controversa]|nr:unnamed protein product [Tilletia controversa]